VPARQIGAKDEYGVWRLHRFGYASKLAAFVFVHGHTRVGCGLRGLPDEIVAPLFAGAPENVLLPIGWREINGEEEAG
jgi:hypothetical protein